MTSPQAAVIGRLLDGLSALRAARPSFEERLIHIEDYPVKLVTRSRKPTSFARQAALPPTLAPRLIGRDAAAAYVSVSPNTFDKMIAEGLMPAPLRLSERRLAWDVRQLDKAIDRLPMDGVVDGNTDTDANDDDHSWDDIDAQAQIKPVAH